MRVAWIVPGPLAQTTGGYLYDRLVIAAVRARGHAVRVHVAASAHDGRSLATRLAQEAPDAIVGDELAFPALGPVFAARPSGAARVLLVHHLGSWERGDARMAAAEKRVIAAADRVVATSRETARRLGVPCVVVEPGADRLPRRAHEPARNGELRLLFVGNLVPRKGVELLLEAIERLDDARVRLVVAGAPRDPRHARSLAARIARIASVKMMGAPGDAALARALARADLFVSPSLLEGYGMAIAEALHAGVPVLATRTGAAPTLGRRTGAVLLVRPGDARALQRALERWGASARDRNELRRRARAARAALPSWGDAGARFAATLESVLRVRSRDSRAAPRGGGR